MIPLPAHVWVGRSVGLLLTWERRESGWWGRVVVLKGDRPMVCVVPGDEIRPVEMPPWESRPGLRERTRRMPPGAP